MVEADRAYGTLGFRLDQRSGRILLGTAVLFCDLTPKGRRWQADQPIDPPLADRQEQHLRQQISDAPGWPSNRRGRGPRTKRTGGSLRPAFSMRLSLAPRAARGLKPAHSGRKAQTRALRGAGAALRTCSSVWSSNFL